MALIICFCFGLVPTLAMAENSKSCHAFVTTDRATTWATPGYSWKDCQPPKDNDDLESALLQRRAETGGKEACRTRLDWPEPGTQIDIKTDKSGEPVYKEFDVIYGGTPIPKKFYQVEYFKNGKKISGWMSEDVLSRPQTEKEDTSIKPDPPQKGNPPRCPPAGSPHSNGAPEVKKQTDKIKEEILSKVPGFERPMDHSKSALSPRKSNAEIDRYMCLYRSSGHDERSFAKQLARFKKAAKAAEESFGVPYALSMCFALTESSLKFVNSGEYRGYGQFGSLRVEDLRLSLKQEPYGKMWSQFQSKTDAPNFSDQAVRNVDSPAAAIGAIALALRQSYGTLFSHAKCTDCSSARGNPKTADMSHINRKDLYLLIGGYNFTPSQIPKMARRTTAGLASSFPPPKESRDYMESVDNCLSKGVEKKFRSASSDRARRGRRSHLYALQNSPKRSPAATTEIKRLKELIAADASLEYEEREAECNRTHPLVSNPTTKKE